MVRTLLLLTLTAAAGAQDCPVHVTDIIRFAPPHQGSELKLYFTNTTDKEISKASFVVSVLDSVGHPHPLMASFESGKVKPGGKKALKNWFNRESLDPDTILKYQAGPRTVQFSDGTSWADDGSGACLWEKH